MTNSSQLFEVNSAIQGRLRVGPLERSVAERFGVALRRSLLREVRGAAVSAVRIDGAGHEFARVDGVVEEAGQIVENLGQVRVGLDEGGVARVAMSVDGPRIVTAAELAGEPEVTVADPTQVIATVEVGGKLEMNVEISSGVGFETVQDLEGKRSGWIEIDRKYGPVAQVAMRVDEEGEGALLRLTVTTDGTVSPEEAVVQAAAALEQREAGSEPVGGLCRGAVEAALKPVQKPEEAAKRPEFRTREICKTAAAVAVPQLTEMPGRSFEAFAQRECKAGARENQGLEKLLREVFPVELASGEKVEYAGYETGAAEVDLRDCARLGRTYAGMLEVRLRGGDGEMRMVKAGRLPLVTGRGTFVIVGKEKVVVGQLRAVEKGTRNDLANRRLVLVGELLREALAGPLAEDAEAVAKVESIGDVALDGLANGIERFFAGGGCVRGVEGTNPLAVVSQVRGVVQSGVGRVDFEARDSHASHFGRLCLLETPEGERIGINLSAAILARVDDEGRMLAPYRRMDGDEVEYLTAEAESAAVIADLKSDEEYTERYGGKVLARDKGEIVRIRAEEARYVPAHPAQHLGASASLIPFAANDDANRALMGTNMQKQAVPPMRSEAPLVRTGIEGRVAEDAEACVRSRAAGVVVRVAADEVVIRKDNGGEMWYGLIGANGSYLGTRPGLRPVVRAGDRVAEGQVIIEGAASDGGILALGRNVLVGYLPWEGYNYEDAMVISERLVRDGVFTSVKTRAFTATIASAAAEVESFGADHLFEAEKAGLTDQGTAPEGTAVEGGDLLIARAVWKGGEWRDASLRMPAGQQGTVTRVERYAAAKGDALEDGVGELARVTVAVRRRLKIGDKLANRHGGKGTVGRIVPEDEMPVLPDGRALDLILNPLGVPSRMNIGQLLETHLGLAAQALNCAVVTPGFNGAGVEDVDRLLAEAGLPQSGMFRLRDGRTGRLFDSESTVGYQYIMKLGHMVDDKMQARCVGEHAEETGQPVGGRRNSGGQRLGVMETWALQAHGAGHILQEMLTVKSDDEVGGRQTYEALLAGDALPGPSVPRSVRRLVAQLRGLCLELRVLREDGAEIDVFAGDAPVDEAAQARIGFVDAERVREWSVERLDGVDGGFEEFFGEDDGLGVKHIELAVPVAHPWRTLVGEGEELPEIAALPVLPRSLRGGSGLDRLYLKVAAANRAVGLGCAEAEALQAAVDQLLGERGLTRLLYGKRGWFAAAMSGKTVDYSGRSVISPGCDLRYDECGLPRRMARTLFEPLVVGELMRAGYAESVAEGRKMLRDGSRVAEEALERAVAEKWVLLHRAPVLHRWGIQAFRPRLTDEDVVRLHPLMMVGFNADFDGDELGVFLPLSAQAQEEARGMRPSANQLAAATELYMNSPTQDMVLGWYYATVKTAKGRAVGRFATPDAVAVAFEQGEVGIHDPVSVDGRRTTVGRALFNRTLPGVWEWIEKVIDKRDLARLMLRCWNELGAEPAARLGDALMRGGFRLATLSGLSIGKDVLKRYSKYSERITEAWRRADELEAKGEDDETARQIVEHWVRVTHEMADGALAEQKEDRDGLNPAYLMRESGARSNRDQAKQLVGMRGLMATPDRRIIGAPCTASFVGGLSSLEYLISTYGARKGLADTALKTASAGFLFKRLVSAVQDLRIVVEDCGTEEGIVKRALRSGASEAGLTERIIGRTARADVTLPGAGAPVVARGGLISREVAEAIEASGLEAVEVRSPVTCRAGGGICARCYGADLSRGRLAELGLTVGITAAQSIGEPMTQLTMRSFATAMPARLGGKLGSIIAGLPRLDELFEAGKRPGGETSRERGLLEEKLRGEGIAATAEYLLSEITGVYRLQGVLVDDRHLEVVIGQMLGKAWVVEAGDAELEVGEIVSAARLAAAGGESAIGEPVVLGVSEAAGLAQDFLAASVAYGGIPGLARAAARQEQVTLDTVRGCAAFGKAIPQGGGRR